MIHLPTPEDRGHSPLDHTFIDQREAMNLHAWFGNDLCEHFSAFSARTLRRGCFLVKQLVLVDPYIYPSLKGRG